MNKFIPYEKLSKRERRARDAERRIGWDMSPVTRRPEKPGAYNRAKTRNRDRKDFGSASCFFVAKANHAVRIFFFQENGQKR